MKRYDKYDELYLLEAIQDAGLKNVQVIASDEIRQKMIDKFVDFSLNKSDERIFLNFKEPTNVYYKNSYCLQVLKNNPQKGKFYLFAEESKSCLVLNNWGEVLEILENLPYMNVYILDELLSYVISVTEEDNMIFTGIELNEKFRNYKE
ncbi:hypothetical protein [Xylocopilactobacillus apicola]|uniref:Uncharacterized protein n=1 Tax=Xylocopilactobacillus apicola TaxID=2932184 RepID=A0AAU9DHE2_9LACO|nr:hypothetical protein [Xylocopilactobacillus apicola]BDR57706.1 hypothetical protein XA3_01470 [Xylocopilactobacillus apicola]